uniref:Uncharacterized protein n=1 Tax=Anguilla anguilla TaxID=7936 RepID=A0A0E9WLX1_ANGAN
MPFLVGRGWKDVRVELVGGAVRGHHSAHLARGGVLKYAQNIITLKREHHIAITESAMLRSPHLLLFKVLWYMCRLLLSFSFWKREKLHCCKFKHLQLPEIVQI